MATIKENTSIRDYQKFVKEVYGLPNDRHFSAWNMLTNVQRFTMRGLKGIRKKDKEKAKTNMIIAISWFMSLLNQFHIDLEREIWNRFPYLCSYCGSCPCVCKEKKIEKRRKIRFKKGKIPVSLKKFQIMFREIYPPKSRTLEDAGIHLAEEMGELSEAVLVFRGSHEEEDFKKVSMESADLFSCFTAVFNSLGVDFAEELSMMFYNNCHVCHKAPCECDFYDVVRFKS